MKKLIVLLLCLAMLPIGALATTPLKVYDLGDNQTLVYALPEGVEDIEVSEVYDMGIANFKLTDASKPNYFMAVSYSEELHEQDLAGLSEEEVAQLAQETAGDSEAFEYKVVTMADGWPAILITYAEESDYVTAFTVISGYFIQVHGAYDDFAPMTQEDDEFALTLLDAIDIIDTPAA